MDIKMNNDRQLAEILKTNPSVQKIFERAEELHMSNWYLGAGGIVQTVWNAAHGFDPEYGIRDYDLVYYDASDTSYEGEDVFIQKGKELFSDIPVLVEIRNQARVHLWYEKHFGHPIDQYKSVEEAISTWPTNVTSVGVRYTDEGLCIHAPFGLDDIFGMVVRANKAQITKKIYEDKVKKWIELWPKITVIPW